LGGNLLLIDELNFAKTFRNKKMITITSIAGNIVINPTFTEHRYIGRVPSRIPVQVHCGKMPFIQRAGAPRTFPSKSGISTPIATTTAIWIRIVEPEELVLGGLLVFDGTGGCAGCGVTLWDRVKPQAEQNRAPSLFCFPHLAQLIIDKHYRM
jgi:hypothetical protein